MTTSIDLPAAERHVLDDLSGQELFEITRQREIDSFIREQADQCFPEAHDTLFFLGKLAQALAIKTVDVYGSEPGMTDFVIDAFADQMRSAARLYDCHKSV